MFEKAKWITRTPWIKWGVPDCDNPPPCPYLTRKFKVEKEIKSAVLNIVGYGQAAYFVNGNPIKSAILPTVNSANDKTVVYNSYDITEMLKTGDNRIGVILGNNYQILPSNIRVSCVKMIAQLDINFSCGETAQIVSNTDWKTADSPIIFERRLFGEHYDSRKEIPNWSSPDFDDTLWDNARICKGAGGNFRKTDIEPVCRIKEIKGKEIAKGLFDFGTNTAGWVKLFVKGKSGQEIVIKYAERITPDGKDIDRRWLTDHENGHTDRYILSGKNEGEVWEQYMLYHGFKYVKVLGEYDFIQLTAVVAYNRLEETAHFSCDNETVNKIHKACINSLNTNRHNTLTDCPQREQNAWTGDGMASAESLNISFDAYNFFFEWMHHFKDEQRFDGQLPCIIPTVNGAWENNFASGPDWDSAIFHIPYYTFKYSGNREIVDLMWENMNRSLKYFSSMSESRLLDFGVGDWGAFDEKGDKNYILCPIEITDTCFYRIAALMMAEMADATERASTEYLALAEKIKQDFRAKYVKNGRLDSDIDTALAISIYSGMLNGEEAVCEAKRLADIITKRGKRVFCGLHGLRTVFEVLSRYGYTQLAFDTIINPDYHSFGYLVNRGLDTLPECLNFDTQTTHEFRSLNHHFFSHIDTWFYKFLAGININGFGFGNVVIEPRFVEGVNRLEATLHGITVSYNEEIIKINSPYSFTFKYKNKATQYSSGNYEFAR